MTAVAVHLYRLDLGGTAARAAELEALLDPEERARAERLRFEHDRRRYVIGRGLLRLVLGERLGESPSAARLGAARFGKPHLLDHPALRFNVTNAGDTGLVALADDAELGIDAEPLPAAGDLEAIARIFFAAEEIRELLAIEPAARPAAFARCWTRKEAYVKALGDGLQVPLDAFAVTFAAGQPATLRRSRRAGDTERWTLADVSGAVPGLTAALCVEAVAIRVTEGEALR